MDTVTTKFKMEALTFLIAHLAAKLIMTSNCQECLSKCSRTSKLTFKAKDLGLRITWLLQE